MSEKKDIRIALWQRDVSGNKSAPIFKGNIEFPDGTKQNVSLWVNGNKKRGAPTYTGVIEEVTASE